MEKQTYRQTDGWTYGHIIEENIVLFERHHMYGDYTSDERRTSVWDKLIHLLLTSDNQNFQQI